MFALLAVVLLLIDLGGTFQNASAFGDRRGDAQLFIDIQVEVRGNFTTVVVHFIDPGDDQQTVALAPRGEGNFYGGQAVVERANLVVVFEGIRVDRSVELSQPTDLVSLGVDPTLLEPSQGGVTVPPRERGTPAWVWLVLAVVAAGLSGMAFWALRDYERSESVSSEASREPSD